MAKIEVDPEALRQFEQGLDPRHPDRSRIPARVLGYGEISTVFAIEAEGLQGLAFKRLPIFRTTEEMDRYSAVHEQYNSLLEEQVGLHLPPHGHVAFVTATGRPIYYIIQKQLPSPSIGSQAIHSLPRQGTVVLVRRVLEELRKVWEFNRRQEKVQLAIDGQISNWSLDEFDPQQPAVGTDTVLWYLDTSTPLFRLQGAEQLNPELFLRSAPFFLAWALRLFFLKDVVDRYYDFRRVVMDLVANFYKEQRADLIPDVLAVVNDYFATAVAAWNVQPITEPEVRSYYREDAFIWSFYLTARKTDRFLRTRLLRREYPYILPEHIKR